MRISDWSSDVCSSDLAQDDPAPADIYKMGTIATVLQLLKLPDGTVKVLVEGNQRARIERFNDNPDFFQADAKAIRIDSGDVRVLEALSRTVVTEFEQYIKLNKKVPPEVLISVNQIDDAGKLADTVAQHLALKIADKQALPVIERVAERPERVYSFLAGELSVLPGEKRLRNHVTPTR